ncbi:hemolysin III family protein [Temperatibacter marinus]|uniref:Hemolysin III family protein n=1 Tax=Temperatibacter marinus TaxID=1456591 RepID=A0AA52EHQ1_9PROT|nr:hemolysin III family protein [Temperatibacter marinus]WND02519.1 hemolysin III family protein [Temperatibacter marinus]
MTAQAQMAAKAYTAGEEIWHAVIHGIAFILSIFALIFMAAKAAESANSLAILASTAFCAGLMLTFATSTLYHCAYQSPFQPFLKLLDHSAIYFAIATGYIPFALLLLPLDIGLPVVIATLSVAVFGTVFKIVKFMVKKQNSLKWVSLGLYLLMGWGAVILSKPLYKALSPEGFMWLLAGGLCYTVGAGFYAAKSMKYSHAIWHFFVVAGAVCHFISVYWYVL